MADYAELLREDLVEQFKEKPVIDALMEAIGEQLNDVRQFYEDLRDCRSLRTAVGKQLDGIGDIVRLTRYEAGALSCVNESSFVIEDETYRKYLIFKIWKNTNNCTYYDIMQALQMFCETPIYYREDPEKPATLILETGSLPADTDVDALLDAPIVRAGGVGLNMTATVLQDEVSTKLFVGSCTMGESGRTEVPVLEIGGVFDTQVVLNTALQDVSSCVEIAEQPILHQLTGEANLGGAMYEQVSSRGTMDELVN